MLSLVFHLTIFILLILGLYFRKINSTVLTNLIVLLTLSTIAFSLIHKNEIANLFAQVALIFLIAKYLLLINHKKNEKS
jgi:hypothetical protein